MYRRIIKPFLDFFLSALALIVLSPLLLAVAVLLFLSNGGKPFFLQKRPGKNGKLFTIIKFKTMNDRRDQNGNLLPDHQRITAVGKLVRKTSLDEIPQLMNVLKGDMSLIGPRPLLPEYLPLYSSFQKRRHEVKPGITGWAQVNGRNALSWEEKFSYDVAYVDRVSLLMDLKIIGITLNKVLRRSDIDAGKEVTMEAFKGTKE